MKKADWSKENYEKSITSHAWGATPYDAGWDESHRYGEDLPASTELKGIFEEEMALDDVPQWAEEVMDRMIGPFPMCGHYAFPHPLLQICEAIGNEKAPDFVCSCYTADSQRKILMSYYVYCLDAWLKDAPLEVATAELAMRDDLGKDWSEIIVSIYESLGAPSEPKRLLVERLIHRLRWWIKTHIWFDDKRDCFMLDVYSGDARGDEADYSSYGNPPFGDPYFAELKLPEIKSLTEKIRGTVSGAQKLLDAIESTWLCAPKVFRYLERIIIDIGNSGSENVPDYGLSILQCEDTYPDVVSHQKWYNAFMSSLTYWLSGDSQALCELGDMAPVKHWLARIVRHKLRLYEKHDPFGNMIGARPSGKDGSKELV
jgi:hypothetical protein